MSDHDLLLIIAVFNVVIALLLLVAIQIFAFTESSILVNVLLRLGDQKIAALPVHDCIIVAESADAVGSQQMLDSYKPYTGLPGRIAVEHAPEG
jgi:hypothetical protein